jgi:predicted amidohydrolase
VPSDLLSALKLKKLRGHNGGGSSSASDIDPAFTPFIKMEKMRLPEGAIRHKMTAAGIAEDRVDAFFLGNRGTTVAAVAPAGVDIDPAFASFIKMEKMRLPEGAIRCKMTAAGIAEDRVDAFFLGNRGTAVAAVAPTGVDIDPTFEPFIKMEKMHLPEGAIRLKMIVTGMAEDRIDAFFCGNRGTAVAAAAPVGVVENAGAGALLAGLSSGTRKLRSAGEGKEKAQGSTVQSSRTKNADDEVAQKARERMALQAEVDSFVGSMRNRRSSRLFALPREGSLQDLLPLINRTTGGSVEHDDDEVLVAFDFDQTLSWAPGSSQGTHPTLRGGGPSLEVLDQLRARNVEMMIVTAAPPTEESAKAIAQEVRRLDVGGHFGVDFNATRKAVVGHCTSHLGEDPKDITLKLALLIIAHTDRCGSDLWRIDASTVTFEVDDTTGYATAASFQAKLPDPQAPGATDWEGLSTSMSSPYHLPQLASRVLHAYMNANHLLRPRQENGDLCSSGLFLQLNDEDGNRYLPSPMSKSTLVQAIETAGDAVGWTLNEINYLLHGEAEMFDMGEGVRFGRCSNIMTAGYNKPEAVAWYIQHLQRRSQNAGDSSSDVAAAGRRIKRVIFVDDNTANVLNLYMMHWPSAAATPLDSDGAEASSMRPQIDAVWFPPPLAGKAESCPEHINAIVRQASIQLEDCDGEDSERAGLENSLEQEKKQVSLFANILVMQQGITDAAKGVALIKMEIAHHGQLTGGQRPNFVLLPEGFVTEVIPNADDLPAKRMSTEHPLYPYATVAKEESVFLICGTCLEPSSNGDGKMYTTTVTFDPSGAVVSVYRKRRIHNPALQAVGMECGVFDSPFGRCAVLICLDSEDPQIVKEMLAHKPVLVFNPIHIPRATGGYRYTDAQVTGGDRAMHPAAKSNWKIAMNSFATKIEGVCREHRCHLGEKHIFLWFVWCACIFSWLAALRLFRFL